MALASTAQDANWLEACRAARDELGALLAARPTTSERAREVGSIGAGGDRTLIIDRDAETAVFDQLDALHAAGHRFTAISEERGVVDYGGGDVRVVIDPIDGSLNAKRGVPAHAISIAVADGPTIGDVAFGFVYDFGAREEWTAVRGEGARLNGVLLDAAAPEQRDANDRLEVVGIESANPGNLVGAPLERLLETAHRLRGVGSIAISLCWVAAARFDGMTSLWRCRAVDAAAAQLIVREAGGRIAFRGYENPLGAPLDLEPHAPVVAARSARGLTDLLPVSNATTIP